MKRFYTQNNIGKAKYVIFFHDGKKTHKDGSTFYDLDIFKSKKKRSEFVVKLKAQGYEKVLS